MYRELWGLTSLLLALLLGSIMPSISSAQSMFIVARLPDEVDGLSSYEN